MKKFSFLWTLMLMLSVSMFLPSCSDDDKEIDTIITDDDKDDDKDPDDPSVGILGENTPTPLPTARFMEVDGGNDGVSIKVTGVENQTFIFELTPGKYVQSYKLDIFPLATLYNYLFEAKKLNPNASMEDLILDAIFASDGSGAYSFSPEFLGDNWDKWEVNWSESSYMQGQIVPDATYIIATTGCPDKDASVPGDLSLCYLTTTSSEVIGSPKVDIEAAGHYQSAAAMFKPNADTHYFYQFCSEAGEIREFISNYGYDLYIDLIRCWFSAPNECYDDGYDSYFSTWTFPNPEPGFEFTASVIALDQNKTKGEYTEETVSLREIPDDSQNAQYEVTSIKASARKLEFKVNLHQSTNVMFFAVLSKNEWDGIKDNPASVAALKASIEEGGWAIDNRAEQEAGIEYNVKDAYTYPLIDNSEYVIVSIARNKYMIYTDPVASEPFSTKLLVTDSPETSEAIVAVTLGNAGRTSFTAYYEFTEETALYYHQIILDPTMIEDYKSGANKERLINYLTTLNGEANIWTSEYGETTDSWTWTGMDPAQKYYYAMIGEDWNGVMTEVAIDSISTLSVVGGPNPEMKIQSLINDREEWVVNFAIVQDVVHHRYMILEDTYSTDPDFTYEDCRQYWTDRVIGEEGFTSVNSESITFKYSRNARYVALCVPYGVDESGNEVRGNLYLQGFDHRLDPNNPTNCIVLEEDFESVFFNQTRTKKASEYGTPESRNNMIMPTAKDISNNPVPYKMEESDKEIPVLSLKKLASSPKFID